MSVTWIRYSPCRAKFPTSGTTASILARILGADSQDLAGEHQGWAKLCMDRAQSRCETGARIRALNLRGIYFQKESKRYYPKRELAAQVLGYVGMDDEGLAGIERSYDSELRGNEGTMLISMDARRKWFGRVERQPDPGDNIVLTIDEKIQYIVEKELDQAMEETGAEAAHRRRAESADRRNPGAGESSDVQSQSLTRR